MGLELHSHVCGYFQQYIGTIFSRKPGIFKVIGRKFSSFVCQDGCEATAHCSRWRLNCKRETTGCFQDTVRHFLSVVVATKPDIFHRVMLLCRQKPVWSSPDTEQVLFVPESNHPIKHRTYGDGSEDKQSKRWKCSHVISDSFDRFHMNMPSNQKNNLQILTPYIQKHVGLC